LPGETRVSSPFWPGTSTWPRSSARAALPGTTIIAAIHDRTLGHLLVPADAIVRLAAGRVLRVL
jgi:hypothetical protein